MTAGARRSLPSRLLIVTDRHQAPRPLPEVVEDLLADGVRWIWLRDRDLPAEERRALALDLAARIARHGGTLTVGADAGLARDCGAGLHVGAWVDVMSARRMLAAGAPIGVSAHGLDDLRRARDAGADYATLSPVFASASKPGYGPALGLGALAEATAIGLPVVALGGVDPQSARRCLAAGAAGFAVMGAAMRVGFAAARWPLGDDADRRD